MKNHFKIILLVCVSILMLSGCQKMGRDFWNGRWEEDRAQKRIDMADEVCNVYRPTRKVLTEEYKNCIRKELKW